MLAVGIPRASEVERRLIDDPDEEVVLSGVGSVAGDAPNAPILGYQ